MWETLQEHPTITKAVKDLWHLLTGYPSTPHYAPVSTHWLNYEPHNEGVAHSESS